MLEGHLNVKSYLQAPPTLHWLMKGSGAGHGQGRTFAYFVFDRMHVHSGEWVSARWQMQGCGWSPSEGPNTGIRFTLCQLEPPFHM